MNYKEATEAMSRKVIEALNRKKQGDYHGALSMVNEMIENETFDDLLRDAYGYRAMLFEELERFNEAKDDYLKSYALISSQPLMAATFANHVTEVQIAMICKKLSQEDESVNWYIRALKTISEGEGTSGGSALKSYLDLVGEENLTDEEKALCKKVVLKSWKLLRIEGEPDLTNLLKTTEEIIIAQRKPRPRD